MRAYITHDYGFGKKQLKDSDQSLSVRALGNVDQTRDMTARRNDRPRCHQGGHPEAIEEEEAMGEWRWDDRQL